MVLSEYAVYSITKKKGNVLVLDYVICSYSNPLLFPLLRVPANVLLRGWPGTEIC